MHCRSNHLLAEHNTNHNTKSKCFSLYQLRQYCLQVHVKLLTALVVCTAPAAQALHVCTVYRPLSHTSLYYRVNTAVDLALQGATHTDPYTQYDLLGFG